MAITSVNLPAHLYSHTEVKVNDNTIRTYARTASDNCKILAVFTSPKGIDRKMTTIDGGLSEFDKTFGVGPFSTYGQPLLNARAAADTGLVTLQSMRLTAPDSTYANNVIWAQYRVAMKHVKTKVLKESAKKDLSKIIYTEDDYDQIEKYVNVLQVRYVQSPGKYVTDRDDLNEDFDKYTKLDNKELNTLREKQQAEPSDSKSMLLPIPELIDTGLETLHTPTTDADKTSKELLQDELWETYLYYADPDEYAKYAKKPSEYATQVDAHETYLEMVKEQLTAAATAFYNDKEYKDDVVITGYTLNEDAAPAEIDGDAYNKLSEELQKFYTKKEEEPDTNTYTRNTGVSSEEKPVLASTATVDEYKLFTEAVQALYTAETTVETSADAKKQNDIAAKVDADIIKYSWQQIPFMAMISTGRGIYGDALGVRLSNHPRADKSNIYKNYYFRVFEGSTPIEGPTRVTLTEESISGTQSFFIEEIVNGINDNGARNVRVNVNKSALSTLFNAYAAYAAPAGSSITQDSFDPILGINKIKAGSRSQNWEKFAEATTADVALTNFEIVDYDMSDEDIQFNRTLGIPLTNGSDGAFALSNPDRDKYIRAAYYDAFTGATDPDILSKTKFPLDAVFDAAFPFGYIMSASDPNRPKYQRSIKCALANLVEQRYEDCFCFLDLGTDKTSVTGSMEYDANDGFTTKEQAYDYADELNDAAKWWTYSIDAYYGKIRDPYNKKIVTVSSTYNLIVNYPKLWKAHGGKHIPYAGSKYGVIDQFIPGTVFPTFDVDLDAAILDRLVDQHVNYAQIDAKGNIIRGSQTTRYPEIGDALTISNLSEINNALIILDIKKDAIKLVADYAYNFNEASDISRFNQDASRIVTKYASAQVRSISASFSRTDEEAELGILHLYITVVHKALVKINLIDIDVNRAVNTNS